MLRRLFRLRGSSSVPNVYKRGRSVRFESFGLRHTPNQQEHSRLSVVVSKKVAKSAPKRNRIRRRVYAHFAQHWSSLAMGQDIVISVFSAETADMPASELARQLEELTHRSGLRQGA